MTTVLSFAHPPTPLWSFGQFLAQCPTCCRRQRLSRCRSTPKQFGLKSSFHFGISKSVDVVCVFFLKKTLSQDCEDCLTRGVEKVSSAKDRWGTKLPQVFSPDYDVHEPTSRTLSMPELTRLHAACMRRCRTIWRDLDGCGSTAKYQANCIGSRSNDAGWKIPDTSTDEGQAPPAFEGNTQRCWQETHPEVHLSGHWWPWWHLSVKGFR